MGTINERDKKRGLVIGKIMENSLDKVVAISPIYYASNFNKYIVAKEVLAIELQDLPENIFHMNNDPIEIVVKRIIKDYNLMLYKAK